MPNEFALSTVDGETPPECVLETPEPQRLKKRLHASVTNLRSQLKRRRQSAPALVLDVFQEGSIDASEEALERSSVTADRFISNRPKLYVPLSTTPRTNRISKQFNLVDDRILNFKDAKHVSGSSSTDDGTMSLLRKNAMSLFSSSPPIRLTSSMENLNKRRQSVLILDSPGIPMDNESSPISWGKRNVIAIASGKSVYYQNLDTTTVSRLSFTDSYGFLAVIRWGDDAHENYMATGMSTGNVEVWDAGTQDGYGTPLHSWITPADSLGVKSVAWNQDSLAVGMDAGDVSIIDVRCQHTQRKLDKHRGRVLSVEWNLNGTYLASGDSGGTVYIWDLKNSTSPLAKLRHRGKTKALSWCPWKSDLLATGSFAPEGKIRIWSMLSALSPSPEPVNTVSLNTTVFSLQWSPNCKELLSTHGRSFLPPCAPGRRTVSFSGVKHTKPEAQPQLTYVQTALTNSITVHDYPSGNRLMTLPNAHGGAITQSCLGPSGENIFTLCPQDEAIKMWHVWGRRAPEPKQSSTFGKYAIR